MSYKAIYFLRFISNFSSIKIVKDSKYKRIDRRWTNWNCNSKFHKNLALWSLYMYTIDIHESYSRNVMRKKVKVRIQYFFIFLNLIFSKNQMFFHFNSLNFIHNLLYIYIFFFIQCIIISRIIVVSRLFHNFRNVYYYFHNTIIYPLYVIIFVTILNLTCIIHIFPFKSGYYKFAFYTSLS